MEIKTSLDWSDVYRTLRMNLHHLPFNVDLYKMAANIDKMVDELSKLEVEARRMRKPQYTQKLVDQINQAINHLEKLIVVATLMA